MKVQSAFLSITAAFAIISGACSSNPSASSGTGGSSSTGGTPGTGGSSSGTGGGASCPNGTACGGNVVGTWTVSSSCLTLNDDNLDIAAAGLSPSTCSNVKLTGSLSVTGTWTANADTTYTDNTTTSGTAQIQLPSGCLLLSGTNVTCDRLASPLSGLGFAPNSVTCTEASGGGCTCTGTIQQSGGIGLLSSDAQTSGNYATSGNTFTADGTTTYSYCVAGNQLTVTPQPTSPATTGTIVLQKSGTTATGGTTGTGGTSSTGGTTGTGGASATGGSGGKGGTGGMAGAKGTGGATSSGGSTGTGGTTATGGTTGTGGTTTAAAGPCDIYQTAGQPCAAAYSMIRVLSMAYTGPLYQVRSGISSMNCQLPGGTTKDSS